MELKRLFAAVVFVLGLSVPAHAQTRLYFPSTGTPAISPAFGGGWGITTNADRREMVTTRISSTMTNKVGVGTAGTELQLLRQYISSQSLAAQTISGTVKGQVRGMGTTSTTGNLAVRVATVDSTGTTVTELLVVSHDTSSPNTFTADPALTNRKFSQDSADFVLELASTGVSAGDFLIVEVGYKDQTGNGTRFVTLSLGDDSGTDLAEDETTTTANNPWIEFSGTITFGGGGGGGDSTPAKGMLMGVGGEIWDFLLDCIQ